MFSFSLHIGDDICVLKHENWSEHFILFLEPLVSVFGKLQLVNFLACFLLWPVVEKCQWSETLTGKMSWGSSAFLISFSCVVV